MPIFNLNYRMMTHLFQVFLILILSIRVACAQIPPPPGLMECIGNLIQPNCEQTVERNGSCINYFGGSQIAGDSKYYQCTDGASKAACVANLSAQCTLPENNSSQSKN